MIGVAWGGSDEEFDSGKDTKLPGTSGHSKRIVVPSGRSMDECYPIRVVAIHFCYPDTAFYRLIRAFYVLVMPVAYLPRVIFHCGKSHTACRTKILMKITNTEVKVQIEFLRLNHVTYFPVSNLKISHLL